MSSLLPVLQILEHMQGGRRVNRRYARRSEDTEQMSVMDWAQWNQNAHPELELLHHCPNGGEPQQSGSSEIEADERESWDSGSVSSGSDGNVQRFVH